jgi:hypothetical protein
MKLTDFEDFGLDNYTAVEVENTGAKLEDVKLNLMISVQRFRENVNRRVRLLPNGLTTGGHKSPEHPNGEAADCAFYAEDGSITIGVIVKAALDAGIKGLGVYWNGIAFSVHLDVGKRRRFWYAEKDGPDAMGWEFKSLFVTPSPNISSKSPK